MAPSTQTIIEKRRDQMFPVLEPVEIERVRRFDLAGEVVRGTNPILRGMAHLPLTLVPA